MPLLNSLKRGVLIGSIMTSMTSFASDFEDSFMPYKSGFPTHDGLSAGDIIDTNNVDTYKELLDTGTYQFVKNGDYQIEVAPTIDFILNNKYIDASKKNTDVGFDAKGNLTNYINGRPFPFVPDANDPDAGKKLMWNFQYGTVWSDLGCLEPWYWEYKNMKTESIERTVKFDKVCFGRKAYRTQFEPVPEITPNPSEVFRTMYLKVAEPFDIKNTQLLIHKYKDDTKRVDGWLYLGFQRRVRRMATGQVTDSFLGSDIMVEDFEGFNGRISDFDFEYLGTKTLLMPMWDRDNIKSKGKKYKIEETGFEYVDFTGRGQCFPEAPWMLRKVHIVKGSPKDKNHPLSHRIHYIDAQTNDMPIILIYDRAGKYWKWFHIGWPHSKSTQNKDSGIMIGDTASLVDVQADHCTTIHFNGRVGEDLTDDSIFTVQNMRSSGR